MTKTFLPLALAAMPFALAAAIAVPAAASAAERLPPHIVVSGEGESTVAPDMAVLSLTVMREAYPPAFCRSGTTVEIGGLWIGLDDWSRRAAGTVYRSYRWRARQHRGGLSAGRRGSCRPRASYRGRFRPGSGTRYGRAACDEACACALRIIRRDRLKGQNAGAPACHRPPPGSPLSSLPVGC